MSTDYELTEGIKWNGPNYSINGEDRITIRINPPKQLQVIFHRGAKVKEPPAERLLKHLITINVSVHLSRPNKQRFLFPHL